MVVSRNSTLTTDYEFSPAKVTPASQAENAGSIPAARSTLIQVQSKRNGTIGVTIIVHRRRTLSII
jgi:hypothetical protein